MGARRARRERKLQGRTLYRRGIGNSSSEHAATHVKAGKQHPGNVMNATLRSGRMTLP